MKHSRRRNFCNYPPTTLKAGKLGAHPNQARDEMFVNPSSALSLKGPATLSDGKNWMQTYERSMRAPRAGTDLGRAANERTRG